MEQFIQRNSALKTTTARGYAICQTKFNQNQEIEDFICLSANQAFSQFIGVELQRLKNQSLTALQFNLVDILQKGNVQEFAQYPKNGKYYNIDILPNEDKTNEFIILIDELTQREQEIQEMHARNAFKHLVQDLPMPMFVTDKDIIVDCNTSCYKTFGFASKEEFLSANTVELSTPTQGKDNINSVEYFAMLMDGAEDKSLFSCEWVYLKKDGTPMITETTYSFREMNGEVLIYAYLRDITEERKAQEALSKEQEKIINELSTPITQLSKGMLFLPLVGHLSQSRADSILHIALQRISDNQGRVLVVDIAGVNDMDNVCAYSLLKLSRATRLMGCTLILSSLSPKAAEKLIEFDINMNEFTASSNLESAIHMGFKLLDMKVNFQYN